MSRHIKRHYISYKVLRPIVYLATKILLNYKCRPAPDIKGPCLILANHTMDWDPILVSCSFKKPINFLASEHTMRMGFLSKIINGLFAPIRRVKGSTDANAALSLVSMIRKGVSVCLFPEGTRSFDGKTDGLHPTTARLVKLCNCTVITYRIKGGYLSSPRWGNDLRRGKINGEVVNVYSADDVKEMPSEQLLSCIRNDIYVNVYDDQKKAPYKFKSNKAAEGIERVLYACPYCNKIGSIISKGRYISCDCGARFRYNDYGFIEGAQEPFNTILGWNEWQASFITDEFNKGSLCISDDDQKLYKLEKDHSLSLVDQGKLSVFNNMLMFNDLKFPLDKIQMDIIRKQDIVFSFDGINYEIHSDKARSALKYYTAFNVAKKSMALK